MAKQDHGGPHSVLGALATEFGDRLGRGVSLSTYSTYRVGGPAAALLRVGSIADLQRACSIVAGSDLATLVIGKGSNLVVSDQGFPGLVLSLDDDFAFIEIDEGTSQVVAGSAAFLPIVARQVTAAGLTGFEWAVGVPGSVGGAVRMNAGGHGSDMAASLVSVTLFDLATGEVSTPAAADLSLAYRNSSIRPDQIVLDATLQLAPGDAEEGSTTLSEIVRWRREHQPGGANGGSVFANPPGQSAGAMIDQAGGKGRRVRSAVVSEKHANFIMADADGSADDVFSLIVEIQRLVHDETGVTLRPENRLIGFDMDRLLS